MRVLKWMIERVEGTAQGQDHTTGVSPSYADLTWEGLDFSADQFNSVISTDKATLLKELELHAELFTQLAHHLPPALIETKAAIEKRLAA
jgi:phosphoenolpyruvate carboxykinase (GTP)